MRVEVVKAAVIVFIASFCTLVIELVAGRIMAPYVGVSLYTWTSIIGVVLAGISVGAWLGGLIADRFPHGSTLGWLLLFSGVASIAIPPLTDLLAADQGIVARLGAGDTLLQRVVILSTLLFFLPALLLGMISPVAVKLAVRDLDRTGRVVGKLYAFSTLGAIAGTFMTGFYLVPRFGTRTILVAIGLLLILTGLVLGELFGRWGRAMGVLLAISIVAAIFADPFLMARVHDRLLPKSLMAEAYHFAESEYYTIRVEKSARTDGGGALQVLYLDQLAHSYNDLYEPAHLTYGYLKLFDEALAWRHRQFDSMRLLFIGGGGYTLPRRAEIVYPRAEIEVVEIDPEVTRTAHQFLGLPPTTAIRTINHDARWFAIRARSTHDVILLDAFNDLSVPFHLTTREFASELKRLLADDGILLVNVIDNFEKGRFLASYIRTLQSVFGEENVALLVEGDDDLTDTQSTFVVIASEELQRVIEGMFGMGTIGDPTTAFGLALPSEQLRTWIASRNAIVMTDDYTPAESLLAPLFAQRYAWDREEESADSR
ncbi:MAG TPA: fused MFS/spermidine synthase [Thermoanaerobaculia bacterium]|nr:fused MFS/spermidine synthase [Thermoanaerobaculia bacterium]